MCSLVRFAGVMRIRHDSEEPFRLAPVVPGTREGHAAGESGNYPTRTPQEVATRNHPIGAVRLKREMRLPIHE